MIKINYKIFIIFIFIFLCGCKENSKKELCKVTFDASNNTSIYTVEVEKEKKLLCPDDPIFDGYDFLGWYFQDELWDFEGNIVTENIILTAKWSIAEYNISYENLCDCSISSPLSYNINTETFILENPVHKKFEFIGWTYEGQDIPVKNVEVSIGSFGDKVFKANWLNVYLDLVNDEYQVSGLRDSDEDYLLIPSAYNGIKVTTIKDFALGLSDDLAYVEIPSTIKYIEEYAFSYCENLTCIKVDEDNLYFKSIDGNLYSKDEKDLIRYAAAKTDTSFTIPNGVENIKTSAFDTAYNLTDIKIPNSVKFIGGGAFSCTNLKEIEIPNSVSIIGDGAFSGCREIVSIVIPDNVTTIGASAFAYCANLESITLSNSITTIEKELFSSCVKLEKIIIPNSVTAISDYAFYCCSKLNEIVIPNSVLSIGQQAFYYCNSLKEIFIPKSVVTIQPYAFIKNYYLTIYCEASSKPSTWADEWSNNYVEWGWTINNFNKKISNNKN